MSDDVQPTCACPPEAPADHVAAWLEIVTLFLVASFLAYSYLTGRVGSFVAPSYIWLTPAAAIALYAMFAARLSAYLRNYDPSQLEEQSAWQVPLSGCVAVLLIPVVLALWVDPRQLSAEGARKRRVATPPRNIKLEKAFQWVLGLATAEQQEGGPARPPLKNPTVLDLLGEVDDGNAEWLEGQFVTVMGQCDLRDGPEGERFELYRLVITCCIADATSVSVEGVRPANIKIEPGGWVRLGGTIQFDSPLDPSLPVVHAATISKIPEPTQPYL